MSEQTDIDNLKLDVSQNKADIVLLKNGQDNMNADISLLKSNVTNINDDIERLGQQLGINPGDPAEPTNPEDIEKLVAEYLREHINNLLCIIIPRHDTSSNWALNDPILNFGEYGVEDDTHRIKRGDGKSNWTDLGYETFGLETLVSNKASDVSYDNTESKIQKTNVQEVLDYIIENIVSLRAGLDLKEVIKNKVYKLSKLDASNITYPSTKAVVDYVEGISGGAVTPDEWQELVNKLNAQQKMIDDLKDTVDELKQRLDDIENYDEEEF